MTPEQSILGDPRAAIEVIRGQIAAMGANDSEDGQINRIIVRLNTGKYADPADAIKDAQAVLDSKQNYH